MSDDDKEFPGFADDGKNPRPNLDLPGGDGLAADPPKKKSGTGSKKRKVALPGQGEGAAAPEPFSGQREEVLREDAAKFPGFADDGKKTPKPQLDFDAEEPQVEVAGDLLPDSSAHQQAVPPPVNPVVADLGGGDAGDGAAEYDGSTGSSRADLWLCPHCGAKNKPSRNTCRACGKSPREKVAKPWFLDPRILGGIAGGIAVVVLVIFLLTRPNYGMKSPSAGNIDTQVRKTMQGGVERSSDAGFFEGRGSFAVCGRVIAIKKNEDGHVTEITVGMGKRVLERADASDISDDGSQVGTKSKFGQLTPIPFARLIPVNLRKDLAEVQHLDVFSMAGQWGSLTSGAATDATKSTYVVYIDQYDRAAD